MHIVLDTFTALEYWLSDLPPATPRYLNGRPPLTSFERTSSREISATLSRAEGKPGQIDLLVGHQTERRNTKNITCNAWGSRALPAHALCEVGPQILVVSPELCLVRLAPLVSRLELVRIMSDFMGRFSLSRVKRMDIVNRQPLVTPESLSLFLEDARGLPGATIVRRALPWIRPGSASPRETSMNLMLSLPTKIGGMGLPQFEANAVIQLSERAKLLTQKSYLVGDAVYGYTHELIKGPVLEYNSNKYHDTEEQQVMDFEKITALESMDIVVIPVSVSQFNSYDAFSEIVSSLRRHLGVSGWSKQEYRGAIDARRSYTHAELLRIERSNRELPSLLDTARWQYLFPYLDLDNPS